MNNYSTHVTTRDVLKIFKTLVWPVGVGVKHKVWLKTHHEHTMKEK